MPENESSQGSRTEAESHKEGLAQERIMELLIEASHLNDTYDGSERRAQIQVELSKGASGWKDTPEGSVGAIDSPEYSLCDYLFVETLANEPSRLPSLFPAFAAMAGLREEGQRVAKVDWDIMKGKQVGAPPPPTPGSR